MKLHSYSVSDRQIRKKVPMSDSHCVGKQASSARQNITKDYKTVQPLSRDLIFTLPTSKATH